LILFNDKMYIYMEGLKTDIIGFITQKKNKNIMKHHIQIWYTTQYEIIEIKMSGQKSVTSQNKSKRSLNIKPSQNHNRTRY